MRWGNIRAGGWFITANNPAREKGTKGVYMCGYLFVSGRETERDFLIKETERTVDLVRPSWFAKKKKKFNCCSISSLSIINCLSLKKHKYAVISLSLAVIRLTKAQLFKACYRSPINSSNRSIVVTHRKHQCMKICIPPRSLSIDFQFYRPSR